MSVIYVIWSLLRRGPASISVPNYKWIALFVKKLLGGSKNFEIGSRNTGRPLWRRSTQEGPSSIYVPNLKRNAQFVQKLLRGPKIWKLGHVTPAMPT